MRSLLLSRDFLSAIVHLLLSPHIISVAPPMAPLSRSVAHGARVGLVSFRAGLVQEREEEVGLWRGDAAAGDEGGGCEGWHQRMGKEVVVGRGGSLVFLGIVSKQKKWKKF